MPNCTNHLDLIQIKRTFEEGKKEVEGQAEKESAALGRKKTSEVSKITKKYNGKIEKINEKKEDRLEWAQEQYLNSAAARVFSELRADYEILQARSEFAEFEPEQIRRISQMSSMLREADSQPERQRLEQMVNMAVTDEPMRRAIKATAEGSLNEKRQIVSYIASGITTENSPTCYILCPIDSEENKRLAKSLQDKIDLVLDHGEAVVGLQTNVDTKRMDVSSHSMVTQGYKSDAEESNGFILYTIAPEEGTLESADAIVRSLTDKFAELQPEGFKETNLKHRVMPVDFQIIERFRQSPLEKLESYLATETRPQTHSASQSEVIRYDGLAPDQAKRLAYQKLDALGEEVTTIEAMNILGMKHTGSFFGNTVKKLKSRKVNLRETNKQIRLFTKDSLREYIDQREYTTGRGWRVPGN